jgi:uncharacterized membrane protein YfcA
MSRVAVLAKARAAGAAGWGVAIGTLGGLIGLGGAEFRLPVLISVFRFAALEAVVLNKATSLVVVVAALVFRTRVVPVSAVLEHWPIIVSLLAGSLVGAWIGADVATRLKATTLYRVIAVLLLVIAVLLMFGHDLSARPQALLVGTPLVLAGIAAGFAIGMVASLLGVAGGELLIPTLVLLFGIGIKVAGSIALTVSLPTMVVGFVRYSRDRSFLVLGRHKWFLAIMAAGSIAGAYLGGQLLGLVPESVLLPLLSILLTFSAIKIWRHE